MHTLLGILSRLGGDAAWWILLSAAADVLALATVPSVLIQRRGRPAAALSWILGLVTLPFVGVALWWAIGRTHLRRKRRRRRAARREVAQRLSSLRASLGTSPPAEPAPLLPIRRLPEDESAGVFPAATGNRVDVFVDGANVYPEIERAVREARHHVHFLFYIWEGDGTGRRFRDLLAAKAREGVKVRALYDAVGGPSVRGAFMRPLREAGARVAAFMPPRLRLRQLTVNFRNHRKIVVIDGRVGFLGGLNIGDEYATRWHDLGVRLVGPVVEQLQEVFADDWHFATRENIVDQDYFGCSGPGCSGDGTRAGAGLATCSVVASGPDTLHNAIHDAFFIAITGARERVWITTPYFIPDSAMQSALRTAVYRGVDVRLLVPRHGDLRLVQLASRSYYPDLLAAGVRIFEYEPAMLHAKSLVFDRDLSVIGSANIDTRSFRLNFEASCFMRGGGVNGRLAEVFEHDLGRSVEVTLRALGRQGSVRRMTEALAHLLSPLL